MNNPHIHLQHVAVHRNTHGRLVLTLADGLVFEGVVPVRAFPLSAPLEGISLVASDGKEVLWVDHMHQLPEAARTLIEQDLAVREFVPTIEAIEKVSSFSTPSTWTLKTDRGPAQMVLKAEEDIRKLAGRTKLLIASSDGVQYRIPDTNQLDKASRRLLERFL